MTEIKLDEIDRRILRILQSDASLSAQDVADHVGLTANPCWRRIKRLEEEGVIKKRVAVLDPQKVGLGMTVFVSIKTEDHSKAWLDVFGKSVRLVPEIIECHRLAGHDDYLMKIQVGSMEHYDRVYKKLVELVPGLVDVSSTFSMEQVKQTTSLDLTMS